MWRSFVTRRPRIPVTPTCYYGLDLPAVTELIGLATEEVIGRELPGITERLNETGYINGELIKMCQNNGIKIAFQQHLLMNDETGRREGGQIRRYGNL